MCLILFAASAHPRYALIVAANRDEAYSRPAAPAAVWTDHPHVYGGRDLDQGGTWLGIARNGRFAAITNYRQGVRNGAAQHSRGHLTRDFLTGNEAPAAYLGRVEERGAQYNGFSLIVGNLGDLWFHSNRGVAARMIPPGVHGLSNHLLDEPWPKVRGGVAEMGSLLEADERELSERLFRRLADRSPAPDDLLPATGIDREREREHSASFIAGDRYGTRASTVLLAGMDGRVLVCERSFGPRGVPAGETMERFELDAGAMRLSPAQART